MAPSWAGPGSFPCGVESLMKDKSAEIAGLDKWEERAAWKRLHMDTFYEAEHGNTLIIADVISDWLEAFPYTDQSKWNVFRCLLTNFWCIREGECIQRPETLVETTKMQND